MVLFVNAHNVTWLLSRPEIAEVDVSDYCIGIQTEHS